jgi:hypothetical protein
MTATEKTREKRIHSFDFALAPGTYECRVIIRNLETGRAARGGIRVIIKDGRQLQ